MGKRSGVLLKIGFSLSVLITGALIVYYILEFNANMAALDTKTIVFLIIYLTLLGLTAAGCVTMIVFNYDTHMPQARIVANVTLVTLFLSLCIAIVISGLRFIELLFVFEFVCIIVFITRTDEGLARNQRFHAPWDIDTDTTRKGYIPLNFFNLFWVFVIASIVGLIIEVIFHAIVFGGYQDRAGLLWGPFSPIYGFGATLMTIALNRYWNRSSIVIFVVAGLIGAAFEFLVSYLMEAAFGVVAWDYSGTFLNIDGRTNFAFFCAWGFLGLVWIKLILPTVLKVVDAIPLKLRAWLTVAMTMFIVADCVMTLVTMDCWYKRDAGIEPSDAIEVYCAQNYDDEYMANRFQSMTMDTSKASRLE